MRLLAIRTFHPEGSARAVLAGELMEVAAAPARQMVRAGNAVNLKTAREMAQDAARARALPYRESR